jgi:hypothetical protein
MNLSNITKNIKLAWILLITFFIFDNIFSYYAVTALNGKEANHLISYWVETYPPLYFFCIPAQIIIIYFIVEGLTKLSEIIFKKFKITNEYIYEKIILFALVIYWAIANSSMNFAFLIGHRLSTSTWYVLTAVGIVLAIVYYAYSLDKVRKEKKKI